MNCPGRLAGKPKTKKNGNKGGKGGTSYPMNSLMLLVVTVLRRTTQKQISIPKALCYGGLMHAMKLALITWKSVRNLASLSWILFRMHEKQ